VKLNQNAGREDFDVPHDGNGRSEEKDDPYTVRKKN